MLRRFLPLLGLALACGDDAKPAPARGGGCAAVVAHYEAECGEELYPLDVCEADEGMWLGAGCAQQWAAYTSCEASAKTDCEEGGSAKCESKLDALFACQSSFVRRTGCSSVGYDESCAKETPYALVCLGGPPSKACVEREDTVCCP